MTLDIITSLITSYINQSYYLENTIQIKDEKRYLKYRSLNFRYSGHEVEIRIHNPEFIEIKTGSKFGCVCDCISTVRNEIDKLVALSYR
jgi:hypothetical protein